MTAPIIFTILASGIQMYPFSKRLILFLVPPILLLAGQGMDLLFNFLHAKNKILGWLVIILLFISILYKPVSYTLERAKSPANIENIKPLLSYLKRYREEGDIIYVYYPTWHAFYFYADQYGFSQDDYIIGIQSRADPDQYLADIDRLRGNKRVWFVFSHNCSTCKVNEMQYYLDYLDKIGVQKEAIERDDVFLYRYKLPAQNIP